LNWWSKAGDLSPGRATTVRVPRGGGGFLRQYSGAPPSRPGTFSTTIPTPCTSLASLRGLRLEPWDRRPYGLDRDDRPDHDERDGFDDRDDPDGCCDDRDVPAEAEASSRLLRWSGAVAAGLQASAWWLRRHPGRLPLLGALGVGLVAGLAGLFAAALTGSAVGVLAMLDVICAGGTLLQAN
jgi:hypothetical protein